MPYTVGKVYERSNPIPMVDTQDPDIAKLQAIGDKIISDEVKSDWILALKNLVGFRMDETDPIRRDNCIDDYDVKDVLFIVTDEGQLIDAMAEYNQYYKSGLESDEDPQDEFESPLTDKLIHASLQGRLFIRPAGERTFRQIQTNVSGPQAEDADVTLSISTPMEKPLMPVAKLQEFTVPQVGAMDVEPMPRPQEPSLFKRIFRIFFRAEWEQYDRAMELWEAHQAMIESTDEAVRAAQESVEEEVENLRALDRQRVNERNDELALIYENIDKIFKIDLTDDELQQEAQEYDNAHEGMGLSYEKKQALENEKKQREAQERLDRLEAKFPGLMKLQQNAKEKLSVVEDSMLDRSVEKVRTHSYLLLPMLQGKGLPEYWDALWENQAVLDMIPGELLHDLSTDLSQDQALVAMLKKNVELALQYPVGSKEFKLLASTNEQMRNTCISIDREYQDSIGYTEKLFAEVSGIVALQSLYENNLMAQERLSQHILEEKPWPNEADMSKTIGRDLAHIVLYNFVDSMLQLNKDSGPEVTRYLYEGISTTLGSDLPTKIAETESFKKMLKAGPEHLSKILMNPEMLQKFAVVTMTELNKDPNTRNTVYEMNMMEREGPLPVNEDGTVAELAPPPVQVQMFR